MTREFGFMLSPDHLQTIVDWRKNIVPQIEAYRERKFADQPWLLEMLSGSVWMSDSGEHLALFTPSGDSDWHLRLSLFPEIYPELQLDLDGGIQAIWDWIVTRRTGNADYDHVRMIMGGLVISHGFYDHLIRLGWSRDMARQYEYLFNPSGLGSSASIRELGQADWVRLEDPDYVP